jgi:hypothetical protein
MPATLSGMGSRTRIVIGAIAAVLGAIWTLQGLNILPGSFMTGDSTWVVIGLIALAAGLVLLATGVNRRGNA